MEGYKVPSTVFSALKKPIFPAVPSHVAALTAGVLQAMFLSKLNVAAAVVLAAGVAGIGAGVSAYHQQDWQQDWGHSYFVLGQ